MIKILELRLLVCLILLKIKLGQAQISVPEIGILISESACIETCRDEDILAQERLEIEFSGRVKLTVRLNVIKPKMSSQITFSTCYKIYNS